MIASSERVVVRRRRAEDVAAFYRWFSDPEVTHFLPLAGKGPLSIERITSFNEQAMTSARPEFALAIDLASGRTVGCGGFRNFVEQESAEISIVIGEKDIWGHGIARESVSLLIDYGFDVLRLNTIWLIVRVDNQRAVLLFERLGFRIVETLAGTVVIDDVPRDKLKMVLDSRGAVRR